MRRISKVGALLVVLLTALAASAAAQADRPGRDTGGVTPIQHLVVIFQENISFDHYFATYPHASNPAGEPRFVARRGTPTVNGLSGTLLTNNLNLVNPFRLGRSQAATCDQDHNYTDEQRAFNGGVM